MITLVIAVQIMRMIVEYIIYKPHRFYWIVDYCYAKKKYILYFNIGKGAKKWGVNITYLKSQVPVLALYIFEIGWPLYVWFEEHFFFCTALEIC